MEDTAEKVIVEEESPSKYDWSDKFSAAEWIADQNENVQITVNATIRSMIKKRRDERMTQKQIRKMDASEFLGMMKDFQEHFKFAQKFGSLGK